MPPRTKRAGSGSVLHPTGELRSPNDVFSMLQCCFPVYLSKFGQLWWPPEKKFLGHKITIFFPRAGFFGRPKKWSAGPGRCKWGMERTQNPLSDAIPASLVRFLQVWWHVRGALRNWWTFFGTGGLFSEPQDFSSEVPHFSSEPHQSAFGTAIFR